MTLEDYEKQGGLFQVYADSDNEETKIIKESWKEPQ